MLALINMKTSEKEQKQKENQGARDEIDLDHSDGEMCSEDSDHGNEVIVLKSTKQPSCNVVASSGSGSIEKFYKPASIEVLQTGFILLSCHLFASLILPLRWSFCLTLCFMHSSSSSLFHSCSGG